MSHDKSRSDNPEQKYRNDSYENGKETRELKKLQNI